jgi:hypothetical protein
MGGAVVELAAIAIPDITNNADHPQLSREGSGQSLPFRLRPENRGRRSLPELEKPFETVRGIKHFVNTVIVRLSCHCWKAPVRLGCTICSSRASRP